MLTEHLINLIILLILTFSLGWLITCVDVQPGSDKKTCRNCFWIYNSQHSVFCSDPDTPVRFLDKTLIKKFHCSRWSKRQS